MGVRSNAASHASGIIQTQSVILGLGARRKPLTAREREVLGVIMSGHSNKKGALILRISYRTFESHRAEIMKKMGVNNVVELVLKVVAQEGSHEPFC